MGNPTLRPTRGPRYPFRATHTSQKVVVAARVNTLVISIDKMIRGLILSADRLGLPPQEHEEIYSNCLLYLWEKALRRYDAHRWPRVKPSTFCHQCLRKFIMREYRRIGRARRRSMETISPDHAMNYPCDGEFLARRIQARARDIITQPEEYMPNHMAKVFRAKVANPHMKAGELAELLGYHNPSALSMMLRRIREVIADVGVENES